MQFYYVILFLHISSALALFMGMAIAWVGIVRLQLADNKIQINEWIKVLSSLKSIFISSGILLLLTGAYMASTKWGWTPWIIVSFLLWLYIVLHSSIVLGKRIRTLRTYLDSNSEKSSKELHEYINKAKLINHLQSELAVGLGTVFIMTVKPELVGAICVVIVAIILGTLPLLSKKKTSESKLNKA
jgi:hypothetical protein